MKMFTIYDTCQAVDRGVVMTDIMLLEKHGGKSSSVFNSGISSHDKT